MHEATLVSALLAAVEREARRHPGARVQRVGVALGELAGVEADLLATAWDALRAGTSCAAASLELAATAARWECPRCGAVLTRGSLLSCPTCAAPARLAAGDDVLLTRIELEVPDV